MTKDLDDLARAVRVGLHHGADPRARMEADASLTELLQRAKRAEERAEQLQASHDRLHLTTSNAVAAKNAAEQERDALRWLLEETRYFAALGMEVPAYIEWGEGPFFTPPPEKDHP